MSYRKLRLWKDKLEKAKMNTRLAVGIGYVGIERNGKEVWGDCGHIEWDDCPTLMKFENMARKDCGLADWRYIYRAAFCGSTYYQRQGRNLWVLVKWNEGFA